MFAQLLANEAQVAQGSGEHQSAPAQQGGGFGGKVRDLLCVLGVAGWHYVGNVKPCILCVGKGAGNLQGGGVLQAAGLGKPAQMRVFAQCGRGKYPCAARRCCWCVLGFFLFVLWQCWRCALRRVAHEGVLHGGSNIQWRLCQAQAVAYVHPAHGIGRLGLAK